MNNHRKDFNYNLVRKNLNNWRLSFLLLIFILIAGIFSFFQMQVEGFPEVSIPIVVITTVVPGAGPETVVNSVTDPIENEILDLDGITDVTSTSRNSVSSIVVQIDPNSEFNKVVDEIKAKVESVRLPSNTESPTVFVPEISSAPFFIAVAGEVSVDDLLDRSELLIEHLERLEEVQSIEFVSDIERRIIVEFSPLYLTDSILSQIRAANIGFPLGSIDTDKGQSGVSGESLLLDILDLEQLPVFLPGTPPVRAELGEIARIFLDIDEGNQINRIGYTKERSLVGSNAILYSVELRKDTDVLKVREKIEKAVENAQNDAGPLAKYVIVFNEAEQSQAQVDEIIQGAFGGRFDIAGPLSYAGYLFGGIWLLVIVMLLFMDWRSALVSVLVIPLSFLITFTVISALGIQLNTIVLFSLILVLGLVVDPAVVVLEAMKRYKELGYEGRAAVLRSVEVVGRGVFIAVLTSFVVFIPFAVVSGTFGSIIKFIPLTVIPALAASYFVPLIFLTWLGVKFIKSSKIRISSQGENDIESLWPVSQMLVRANRWILNHLGTQIVIILLSVIVPIAVAGILFGTGQVKQVQFSQPDDSEFLNVSVPAVSSLSDNSRVEVAKRAEAILNQFPQYIDSYFYGSFSGEIDTESISWLVTLKKIDERNKKSGAVVNEINPFLVAEFGELAAIGELSQGPPTGEYPIQVRIFLDDTAFIRSIGQKIKTQLESYEEVESVKFDDEIINKELFISPLPNRLAKYSLSAPQIYGAVTVYLSEQKLFNLDSTEVVARIAPFLKPTTTEDIKAIIVDSPLGPVRVGELADIQEKSVPPNIAHLNGDRYSVVRAKVKDARDIIGVQRRIDDWALDNSAQLGVARSVFTRDGVENEFDKSFRELFLAIGFSIVITYIIFVLFFKSLGQPFIILFTIPLTLVGVFPALALFTNGQFGFLETLGIITLIGVVENVGIFLIDYANQKKEEGMDKKEAIALASGIRFRPIVLTQMTTLGGLLPLAVFSPFWRGLAVVVIAGILASGILSLFSVPILYSWFTKNKKNGELEHHTV